GNPNDPFGGNGGGFGGSPFGGGSGTSGSPLGAGGGGIGGSTGAEQQEEIRVPPQGCEVFNTDFGPIFSDNYTPAPLVEGDVVKLGYFEMVVSDATASGEGYSGTGYVLIPMLKTKVEVEFTDLKAKPNTLRCYAAEDIRAVGENQFFINPNNLSQATLGNNFTPQFFQNLEAFFTTGQGKTRTVSQFDPANPTPNLLPIAIDKENAPLVVVTGIEFTPRNCFLTCVAYAKNPAGQLMRYAALDIPITPFGVKNGSELTLLDASGASAELAEIFTLKITGGAGNSGMVCDCNGYKSYNLDAELWVKTDVMVQAGGSPSGAGGASQIKIGLKNATSDPATYFGEVEKFADFTLPKMPGFVFSMTSGKVDLKPDQKIEPNSLGSFYSNSTQNEWRGLHLDGVKVKLPTEYDFTGKGQNLTLDQGALAIAAAPGSTSATSAPASPTSPLPASGSPLGAGGEAGGAFGKFKKTNLVSLADGKLGTWRYSVDTMQLSIANSQTDSASLAGKVRVPLLDEPFNYRSQLNVGSAATEMLVHPAPGKRGMSLWSGDFDVSDSTIVTAQLKEVNGERKFFPAAKLFGKLSMNVPKDVFDAKLTGNKSLLVADVKQAFGITGDLDFKLENLPLRNLSIDPYEAPELRFVLGGYGLGNAKDSVSVGGVKKKIGEVALVYRESEGGQPEEVGLKIVAYANASFVQFIFWGKASADGGFLFDRIEVQTENVTCNCASTLSPLETSDLGQIIDRYYDNYYALPGQVKQPDGATEKAAPPSVESSGGSSVQPSSHSTIQPFNAAYETAIKTHLRQNMVEGFILDGSDL
ncbi:MAG: hypothetical protein AAB316_11765, partial [Bacteroidota bacterium]